MRRMEVAVDRVDAVRLERRQVDRRLLPRLEHHLDAEPRDREAVRLIGGVEDAELPAASRRQHDRRRDEDVLVADLGADHLHHGAVVAEAVAHLMTGAITDAAGEERGDGEREQRPPSPNLREAHSVAWSAALPASFTASPAASFAASAA